MNDAPSFVAGTGGLIRVAENTTTVAEFSAIDPEGDALSFSIGGVDAALFDINAETGALSFRAAPDFEAPADADGDNDHELVVSVSDGDLSTSVEVTVRVSDVEETVFFVGTSGRDHLLGSTADETFLLRGGNDMVVTGGGADVIVFTDTPGYRDVVTITDFDSTMDQLDLGGLSVSQSASRAGLTLLILDNNDTIALLGVDEWLS